MRQWFHIIPKNTGLSAFVWIIFCILPFYLIRRSSTLTDIGFGILLISLFFIAYRLSFTAKSKWVYLSVSLEMAISIFTTLHFGYVYLALFLAFFIGKVQHKGGFFALYILHLVTTIAAITMGFFLETHLLTTQLPFVIITVIGIILLPFNMYNRMNREKLENQLEYANKKISKLSVLEERQRIARDLHDTLGQKLSLIRLKSDLAEKLMEITPAEAKKEIREINQTARTALKEVREMVSDMRGAKLENEVVRIGQILKAAQIEWTLTGASKLENIPLLVENVLCMCLKEAITNVVKHSQATWCVVEMNQTSSEFTIDVRDNGVGVLEPLASLKGHGLRGIEERLEFVNGTLEVLSAEETVLHIRVPKVLQPKEQEEIL
ncbi:sensor histidine kinase DesK [Pullulanibacillus camelliae]|uniref:histidine kinase n=1 Tax=Pullulanibacillus camelliae TaxID=1707096 RepID=A0A8J2VMM8_9BACL|nr:sensor histidine kinase [Pullulanibacillus camelliae]GGE31685.1 sensor histidine kinase DesK [Pullulanibacillus camelliae]